MFAVAGGKGGVGKTTSTLALAASFPGQPVVVDADRSMPNLAEMAGVDAPSLDAVVESGTAPEPAPAHDCRVVASPHKGAPRTERLLTQFSHRGAFSDSTIIVDCPAGASVDAAAPLAVVDGVVLVSTSCAPALRDTLKTASMARAVGTPVLGVVLTRTSLRPPHVSSLFDAPLLATVPPVTADPLSNPRVRERYDAAAAALDGVVSGRPDSPTTGV